MPAGGRGREGAARRVCVRRLERGGRRDEEAIGRRSNGRIEGRRDGLARHLSRGIWKPSPSPVLEVTALVGNSKLSTRTELSKKKIHLRDLRSTAHHINNNGAYKGKEGQVAEEGEG